MKKVYLLICLGIFGLVSCSYDVGFNDITSTSVEESLDDTISENRVKVDGEDKKPDSRRLGKNKSGIRVLDEATFKQILLNDPNIPTKSRDILELAIALYPKRTRAGMFFPSEIKLSNGVHLDLTEEEEIKYGHDLLYWAVQNPGIPISTRRRVVRIKKDNALPFPNLRRLLEKPKREDSSKSRLSLQINGDSTQESSDSSVCESYNSHPFGLSFCFSEHFYLGWYYKVPANANGNITENDILPPEHEGIAFDTIKYLEAAWDVYEQNFSKVPELYPFNDQNLIKIEFSYLGPNSFGLSEFSEDWNPFSFNTLTFNPVEFIANPSVIKPVTAHELFHRLQYAYGYKSNEDNDFQKWFSEGTASWAETLVWNQVRNEKKLTYIYDNPREDFTEEIYAAGEFWYYFNKHLDSMNDFMEAYETDGKIDFGGVINAINLVLADKFPPNTVFGEFEDYLALYRRNKISHEYVPANVINEFGKLVSPLEVDLYFKNLDSNFFQQGTIGLGGFNEANGTEYVAIYVNQDLKGLGKTMELNFLPSSTSGIEFQYQIIFAKCTVQEERCGFIKNDPPHTYKYTSNIIKENYQFTKIIFPFFATGEFNYTIELDEASNDWDLIYVVVGYHQDSFESVGLQLNILD